MAIKVERTRGSKTLTESGFWGMVRSALRKKSMYWKPLQDAKKEARRPSKSENKRLKFEYQCSSCKKWYPEKEIEVDHIVDAGSLRNGDDLKSFVERLFCEKEGFQVLCKTNCHRQKTATIVKKITKKPSKTCEK